MTGGVLNAINTRLDAPTIAHILQHGEASIEYLMVSASVSLPPPASTRRARVTF